jgi:hypothetical protein
VAALTSRPCSAEGSAPFWATSSSISEFNPGFCFAAVSA